MSTTIISNYEHIGWSACVNTSVSSVEQRIRLFCNWFEFNFPRFAIPYHTIPYHTIPYHTIPYHTMPCLTILYFLKTFLYTAVLGETLQVVSFRGCSCSSCGWPAYDFLSKFQVSLRKKAGLYLFTSSKTLDLTKKRT